MRHFTPDTRIQAASIIADLVARALTNTEEWETFEEAYRALARMTNAEAVTMGLVKKNGVTVTITLDFSQDDTTGGKPEGGPH